jgi:hypothetical protein
MSIHFYNNVNFYLFLILSPAVGSSDSRSLVPNGSQMFGSQPVTLQPMSPFLTPARTSPRFSFQLVPLHQQQHQQSTPAGELSMTPLSSTPLPNSIRCQPSGQELDMGRVSINNTSPLVTKSSKPARRPKAATRSTPTTRSRRKLTQSVNDSRILDQSSHGNLNVNFSC